MKLVKIKTLEARVWHLCKQIIRAKYSHICISCGNAVEGKQLHTGHYFRKKYIPLPMKYDLRLLRPQCAYCNMRLHGNLEWYTVGLLESHTAEYILQIAKEIKYWKENPMGTKESREFLLGLEKQYAIIFASYQRIA